MAMWASNQQESSAEGFRAHVRDNSLRSTASLDQLKSGELLKRGNEVREAAFPATSGGYGEGLEPPLTIHADDEPLPKSRSDSVADEQSFESYYDALGAAAPQSAGSYKEDVRETAPASGDLLKSGGEVQELSAAGYGGVSEEEPPHHKIQTDAELLPKPTSGSFTEGQGAQSCHDASETESIAVYQDARATESESFNESHHHGATNETDGALFDRSTFDLGRDREVSGVTEPDTLENGAAEAANEHGSYAITELPGSPKYDRDVSEPTRDDTNADALIPKFPDAPTGTKVAHGYGYNQADIAEPTLESAPEDGSDHPARKEGFMTKMIDKLPDHHHKSAEIATPEHDRSAPVEQHDTSTSSPEEGLMEKIKEKLPGHQGTTV